MKMIKKNTITKDGEKECTNQIVTENFPKWKKTKESMDEITTKICLDKKKLDKQVWTIYLLKS